MSGKGRGRRSYRDLIGQGKARMVKARLPESPRNQKPVVTLNDSRCVIERSG
jgi:hypothetical protein